MGDGWVIKFAECVAGSSEAGRNVFFFNPTHNLYYWLFEYVEFESDYSNMS